MRAEAVDRTVQYLWLDRSQPFVLQRVRQTSLVQTMRRSGFWVQL